MQILRPAVGAILVVLGVMTISSALEAQAMSASDAAQLWTYAFAYVASGLLVLLGVEFGAWGGLTITLVILMIVGAQLVQAEGPAQIPLASWLSVVANGFALVGSVVLLRMDPPTVEAR